MPLLTVTDEGNGLVGQMAKLDPANGKDWVDNCLLELIVVRYFCCFCGQGVGKDWSGVCLQELIVTCPGPSGIPFQVSLSVYDDQSVFGSRG